MYVLNDYEVPKIAFFRFTCLNGDVIGGRGLHSIIGQEIPVPATVLQIVLKVKSHLVKTL